MIGIVVGFLGLDAQNKGLTKRETKLAYLVPIISCLVAMFSVAGFIGDLGLIIGFVLFYILHILFGPYVGFLEDNDYVLN